MSSKKAFNIAWWLMFIEMCLVSAAPRWDNVFLSLFFGELLIVIPLLLGAFLLKLGGEDDLKNSLGIKPLQKEYIPWIILLTVTFKFYSPTIMPGIEALLVALFEDTEYILPNTTFGSLIVLCVLAPVLEELLSRGVIFSLLKRTGTLSALIFSSLGFAIMHLDAVSAIPIFFMGLLLGILRITTGSLLAPMIAHSLSNLFAFLVLKIEMYNNTAISFTVIGMIFFPLILWRFLENVKDKEKISMKFKSTGVSLGMILSFLLFFGYNVLILIGKNA